MGKPSTLGTAAGPVLAGVIALGAGFATTTHAQQAPAETAPPQGQAPAAAPTPEAATAPAAETPPPTGAEGGPPDSAPPADAAQPAAPAPIAADPAVLEEARKHFRQGVAFASAGNCSAAIVEFEEAYRLIPRPNAIYNIAQCQERMFRYDLAIASYERYLEVAPPDAEDRPAVETALRTLGNLLGRVKVEVDIPVEVWVDDRLAGEGPGEVYVPAGGHSLEVRAEGYIPARKEVRVVGKQQVIVQLTLIKAETTVQVTETTGLDPTLFWIGVAATTVTAAVGGFFALRVQSLKDDAEALPTVHPARVAAKRDVEDAEVTADIFFASTALLAIGTTIVAFVTDWDYDTRPPELEDEEVSVRPVTGPGVVGVAVGGSL